MANQPKKYQKFVATAATATLVAAAIVPTASAAVFNDTASYDKETLAELDRAVELGFVKGFENGDFKPADYVTRGQVAKILARHIVSEAGYDTDLNGLKEYVEEFEITDGFSDVSEKRDSELYFASLIVKSQDVFTGNEKNQLLPEKNITRQQMAKVLVNAFGLEGTDEEVEISDLDKATKEFQEYIVILAQNGVTKANPYKPGEAVKRIQMASFTVRAYDAAETTPVDEVKVESVKALNPTTIQVVFSDDLTEDQAKKENFKLSKGEIESVKVDGKVATISVSGLTYGSKTTVTVVDPAHTAEVTVPEVSEIYVLEMTTDAPNDTIKSDGASKTQVTVTLKDRNTGEVVKKDGVVQFQATRGGLGQTTSALQNGKATVQLTSVASATSMTSIVTATVSDVPGAAEFEGLTSQKAVTFSPDVTEVETNFVQVVSAEASTGDRLHVQFSDKISAEAYKKEIEKKVAPAKVKATDYGIQVHGKDIAVKDVVQLTDNTLEFILDVDSKTPTKQDVAQNNNSHKRIEAGWAGATATATDNTKNYLRDNVTHVVSFKDNVGGLVLANSGVSFILTDTARPAVLGVTAKDQLEFTVRFTKAMDERTIEGAPENFVLDGREVVVNADPTASEVATAKQKNQVIVTSLKVGEYSFKAGKPVDERNLATFKLHKDFALAGGVHQIQIAKVTDWSGDVDPIQNTLATDTFDFTVSVDNTIPVPQVEVQSAEQWLVSFDKQVSSVTGKTAKDVFKVATADSTDKELVYGTDYVVTALSADEIYGKELKAGDKVNAEDKFLIEFKEDWTKYYDTKANPTATYFASTKNPYKITVDNLESLVGNKIAKQELEVKLSYDGVSPTITKAVDTSTTDLKGYRVNTSPTKVTEVKTAGKAILVEMSEPVKINNSNVKNTEGLTPSQSQVNDAGVPVPTYEFVKGDKVIKAKVAEDTLAANDKSFVVVPEEDLTEGEWTLYIRSISDDIGNTSATVSTKVAVPKVESAVTKTQMAWAAFNDSDNANKLVPNNPSAQNDVIYVKFTKAMKADGANGVSRTQNYVFRGQPLPAGSQVVKGIEGVTKDWDGVTILMPKDSWNGVGNGKADFGAAFNIASNFQAADGEALSGAFEVELKDTNGIVNTQQFEAIYTGEKDGFGLIGNKDGKSAVLKATASEATGKVNGKIDTVTLDLQKSVTVDKDTTILVDGKKFTIGTSDYTGDKPVFTAVKEEVNGTTTNGLAITNNDGAILVNKDAVIDKVAPVATKAEVSANGQTIKVTFSESIQQAVVADTALDITGTGTVTGNAQEVGDNFVVFSVGTAFVAGDTVDVAANQTAVKDKAGNEAQPLSGAKVKVSVPNTGGTVSTGVTGTASTSTAGQETVAGTPGTASTAKFKVATGATKSGNITVKIVKAGTPTTETVAVTAGQNATAVAAAIAANGFPGYTVTASGEEVTFQEDTPFSGKTFTVEIN